MLYFLNQDDSRIAIGHVICVTGNGLTIRVLSVNPVEVTWSPFLTSHPMEGGKILLNPAIRAATFG